MGLDMYLDKIYHVSEFDKTENGVIDKIYNFVGVKDSSQNYKHLEVKFPAIYWRKSNQIHAWFVKEVQGNQDDCKNYEVDISHLKQLLGIIKAQLKNKKEIILRPQSGFFFGSTDIDDYYWKDLERTKKDLEREIKFYEAEMALGRSWYYEYRSSW